ncbi:MAG: hypothetical protein AAF196_06015 [Planctomycetota bacterium]
MRWIRLSVALMLFSSAPSAMQPLEPSVFQEPEAEFRYVLENGWGPGFAHSLRLRLRYAVGAGELMSEPEVVVDAASNSITIRGAQAGVQHGLSLLLDWDRSAESQDRDWEEVEMHHCGVQRAIHLADAMIRPTIMAPKVRSIAEGSPQVFLVPPAVTVADDGERSKVLRVFGTREERDRIRAFLREVDRVQSEEVRGTDSKSDHHPRGANSASPESPTSVSNRPIRFERIGADGILGRVVSENVVTAGELVRCMRVVWPNDLVHDAEDPYFNEPVTWPMRVQGSTADVRCAFLAVLASAGFSFGRRGDSDQESCFDEVVRPRRTRGAQVAQARYCESVEQLLTGDWIGSETVQVLVESDPASVVPQRNRSSAWPFGRGYLATAQVGEDGRAFLIQGPVRLVQAAAVALRDAEPAGLAR